MRKVTITEQEKAEIEASERADRRKLGFGLMGVRDTGHHQLSNGVLMSWRPEHINEKKEMIQMAAAKDPDNVYVYPPEFNIPPGSFILQVDGKSIPFDKEEFMRYLRWV